MPIFIEYIILFLNYLIRIFYWIMIVYIISSWIFFRPNRFTSFIQQIVAPILFPFRWAKIGGVDLSPIIALLMIEFLGTILITYLRAFLPA